MYSDNGRFSIEFGNPCNLMQPQAIRSEAAESPSHKLLLSLEIDSSRHNIAGVEASLEAICSDAQITPKRAFFITLATSEALCNIIEHGYGFEAGHAITINAYYRSDNTLEVSLQDTADAIDPALVTKLTSRHCEMPETNTTLEQLPESNWGTNLITHATSEVRYARHHGQNFLTLCFSL